MKGYGHHLQEARLFEAYLAVQGGERPDPPIAEHLTDCDECGGRYADLTRFMDMVSVEGAADADAVFSAEHLREQRQVIARRIEHLGHSARVITFPGRGQGQHLGSSSPRPARRWVAAAAAAGLVVGVGTGLFLDREAGRGAARRATMAHQTGLSAPISRLDGGRLEADRLDTGRLEVSRREIVRPESDEAFLSELELAGERPHIRELIAVDALTPHVHEITLR